MLRHFSADFIFPVSGEPLERGIVSVNEKGEIIDVHDSISGGLITDTVERYEGIIVPGFVNAHCHLELSHMLGKIAGAEGLISFISSVMSQRHTDDALVLASMEKYDQVMFEKGIVAVGDISNNHLSRSVKQKSRIYYHTFIELLGFDPGKAEDVFNRALDLKKEFAPLPASIAPHAPYSVSEELFILLKKYSDNHDNLISMHNQESGEENDLFRSKSGGFIDFYRMLNLDISFFKPHNQSSLLSMLPLISDKQKLLLVHNTYTSQADVQFADQSGRELYWCFCPKANLYIEGKLPEIETFLSDQNITIGTDSLASNDDLCILSELKTIREHYPQIPFEQTIRWATLNGAAFLGIDKHFGSIEKGKTPGLNLISNVNGQELSTQSKVRRLI